MAATAKVAKVKDWRPWIVWGLGALFFAYAFFQRVAPSVMADHLMAELALTGAAVGNLSAIYFYSYAGLQIPVGLMVDRYGPRRLMALGTLACAGGAALFGLAKSEEMALIGRLLVGSGAAFSFVAAITLAARWFPATRFAQFTGLTMMVGMAGGLLGQAPLGLAVESFGWRSALYVSALLGLFIALAIWLKVRDFPDDLPLEERDKPGPILAALFRVLRRPKNLMLSVIALALSAPNLGFAGFWAVPWLMQTEGLDRAAAGATASLMLIGWAFGAPCGGWLSDRLGRRKPVILLGLVLGITAMTVLLFVPGLPRPLFWACFFSAGAAGGCMSALYALLRNVNPASEIGAAFGLVNGANVAAGAVFQPMIGFILDRLWDGRVVQGVRFYSGEAYQMALASIPAFMGIALILALFLKEKKTP